MGSGPTAGVTRWRRALLPLVVGGAVALAGIGPIAQDAREYRLRQLDVAMAKWREAAVGDHRLIVEKECSCADPSPPQTVEALFEQVALAIDLRPDAFEVVYDARYGLPSFLRVGRSREFVDDELILRVTAFEPMARESAVRGRILDLDRQPLAGAEVTLARGDQRLSATTGDDGVFYIEAPPGAYRLAATRPGRAMPDPGALVLVWDGRETSGSWQLVPDALLTGRPVSSEPIAGDAAALTGRVVDVSGAAIPGVTVKMTGSQGLRSVVTNARGEFALTDLAAGVHTLTASLTGFAPSTRQVELEPSRRTEVGVLMSIGRGPSSEEERERRIAELDAMLTRWRESRPAAYAYTVSRLDGPDRATVHVGGHVATFGPDLPAGRAYLLQHYSGMDKLFERIAWAIERRAGLFAVRYDPDYGHPLSIVIDVSRSALHDELNLRVSDFRPVY